MKARPTAFAIPDTPDAPDALDTPDTRMSMVDPDFITLQTTM